MAVEFLDVYSKDPKINDQALAAAMTAKNPESVAKCATLMCYKVANRFEATNGKKWNEAYSRTYADRLMTMSGNLDPGTVGELETYLAGDGHRKDSPNMSRGKNRDERTKNRNEHVGAALMAADGTLDFAKGHAAMLDVMFHPDSLRNPTPALTVHMIDTIDLLKGSAEAQEMIKDVTAPETDSAKGLIARASGKDASAVGKGDAQLAVLNAMMTPVYQGKVGSCFVTAGIVRLREEFPLDALESYADLATKGTFTPKTGDPVNAVQNVPGDENPLVRSLEYTAATACAIIADSSQHDKLGRASRAGAAKFEDKVKDDKWLEVMTKLGTAIPGAFTFVYDPEAAIEDSNDGSSKNGRYQLMNKATGAPVNSKEDYIAAVKPLVLAAITAEELGDGVTGDDISAVIESEEFMEAIKRGGKMPWELSSGGQTGEAAKTLFGGTGDTVGFLGEADASTSNASDRTKNVLTGMLTNFDGSAAEMATIRTVGMHGFNALPQHPSLDKLKDGGPAEFANNIQAELLDKGAALRDAELPLERVIYMFEQEMKSIGDGAKGEAKEALDAAITTHRPTVAMKPAELQAHIKVSTADYVAKKAKADADRWKSRETEKKGAAPSDEAYQKELEKRTKRAGDGIESSAMNRLMTELGAPEFVIADTNWGSGQDRTLFVIAPDLETGLPQMYKKKAPPGSLTPVEKKWVDAQWASVE